MASDINRIKVGQQVVLTIGVDGSIEGDYFGSVCGINAEKTRVHLKDVVFGATKQKFSGAKVFYLSEILAIKIISDVEDDIVYPRDTETTSDDRIKFELNAKEKEINENLIKNHCTIETVGEEFDRALQDISHYYFIGLTAHIGDGESGYIVCSTPHQVYAFNIKTIGEINGQFRNWFESDEHTKVVHGSILEEDLYHCYGIIVKGIFDTELAYKMIDTDVEVPLQLVQEMKSCTITTLIDRTAILLKFHDFLTEHLLKNVYQSFQLNLDYCRNKKSIEVQAIYRDGKSIVSKLPKFQCLNLRRS